MTVHTVSTSEEFLIALKTATGGDIIELAPGAEKFRASVWQPELTHFEQELVIRSADPEQPAVIDQLIMTRMSNVRITDVQFSGEMRSSHNEDDLILKGCQDITVSGVTFAGQADGFGMPRVAGEPFVGGAMMVSGCTGVTVEESDIGHYLRGITHRNNTDLTVRDTAFHHIQEDGMRGGGVNGLLVEGNSFSEWYGILYEYLHADFIQIWSHSTAQRTENIEIRGNLFAGNVEGVENANQAIFARNDEIEIFGGDEEQWTFRNFVIADNIIDSSFQGAVKLSHVDGVEIVNNTILGEGRIRVKDADGVEITGNISAGIDAAGSQNVNEAGNLIVQETLLDQPDHITAVVRNLQQFRDGGDLSGLSLRDGVPAVGADPFGVAPAAGLSLVIEADPFDYATRLQTTYQAVLLDGAGQLVDLAGAVIEWSVAGKLVAQGAEITHQHEGVGLHGVQLSVTLPDGVQLQAETETFIPEITLFDLDLGAQGAWDLRDPAAALDLDPAALVEDAALGGWALEVPQEGAVKLDPAAPLSLLPVMSLDFTFCIDPESGAGTLLNKQDVMQVNVREDGRLLIKLIDPDGKTQYNYFTEDDRFADGAWHHMALTFDGLESDEARIYLDGALSYSQEMDWQAPMRDAPFFLGSRSGSTPEARLGDLNLASEAWDGAEVSDRFAEAFAPKTADAPLFDPDTLLFSFDDQALPETLPLTYIPANLGPVYQLEDRSSVTIDVGTDLAGQDSLSVEFAFRRDGADSEGGALFNKQGWFQINMRGNGELLLKLIEEDGTHLNHFTQGAALDDSEWHHLAMVIDGDEDMAHLYIDGVDFGAVEYGAAAPQRDEDFRFGSPWVDAMDGAVTGLRIADEAWDADLVAAAHAAFVETLDGLAA